MAIPLTQGLYALIDGEDYEWLNRWKWHAQRAKNDICYAVRLERKISMHRIITNAPKNKQVDHINHNGLDNRRCNLRICTNSQNSQSRRLSLNKTSKYKGVMWDKRCKKWYVQITCFYKQAYLGRYDNEIEAAKTYDKKAKELFGEFALTNF